MGACASRLKAEPTKATRLERPGRKAVDLNAAERQARRTDAAVAEVMPQRDEKSEGRRRSHARARPGLAVFAGREKHCKNAGFVRARAPFKRPCESNWAAPPDILDWHVAAILIPYRSRGLG